VLDSADDFGVCDAGHFGVAIPIAGVAGDQHAALIGQACFQSGMSKCTYGTGCFLVLNTGDTAVPSNHGLLTTMAYRLNGKPTYAMEGSAFIAGAVVQWLRDELQILSNASESHKMAQASKQSHVFFVPAFTGLGAPYWNPNARAAIFGMTRDTGRNEIVAAALESVCFQTMDLLKAMELDGAQTKALRVDGGMTANDHAMQTMANLAQTRVVRPSFTETTALGSAYLAGLQLGVFKSLEEIAQLWAEDQSFDVKADAKWSQERYHTWQKAVKACQLFSE
jgi:glycerol kinase